jgi:zinc transport system substrate-binding protein
MKNKFLKLIGLSIASLIVSFCASCDGINSDGKLNIIATIFPEYDYVMNVLGDKKDNFNVTLLLDSGVDLHSYQPSPKDIVKISNCDLFIYVGGESDEWVDDVLKQTKNKDMLTINLMDVLGDKKKEEEIIEGMQGEEEEGEEEEVEYDEHVWLSLKNAQIFVTEISNAISSLNQENASYYASNAASYNASLKDLDDRYITAVAEGTQKTLLFADRFPFRYLTDDYGLKYYAAFIGCSAETEASFETIAFLAGKVDELGLKVILKIESSDGAIANTVKNATQNKNQTILTMDSIQSATSKEYKSGRNYLSIMEANLNVLKEAIK